jgi:hypothetical protein
MTQPTAILPFIPGGAEFRRTRELFGALERTFAFDHVVLGA